MTQRLARMYSSIRSAPQHPDTWRQTGAGAGHAQRSDALAPTQGTQHAHGARACSPFHTDGAHTACTVTVPHEACTSYPPVCTERPSCGVELDDKVLEFSDSHGDSLGDRPSCSHNALRQAVWH